MWGENKWMHQGSEAKWGPFISGSPLVIGGWGGGRYVKSFTHQQTFIKQGLVPVMGLDCGMGMQKWMSWDPGVHILRW